MKVQGWLARAAAAHPRRAAVESAAGTLTYSALAERARTMADLLDRWGARAGDRIVLELPPGLDFAVALHACLLRAAVAVPVDLRLPDAERARLANTARLVIGPAQASPQVPDGPQGPSAPPAPRHDLAAVATIIQTSGTTGQATPVELTYGNWLWSALGSAVALGSDPAERWLCALPLSHVGGLSILLRSAIYQTTAVVHERFDTEVVLAALREEGITLVSLVATTLLRLLEAGLHDPPTLRCALVGGGPVSPALLDRARRAGVPVRQTYGLTEACSQVTTGPIASDALDGTAGPPLFCTRVRIASDGEILVRGPTVAPRARAGDGWLHTGDLGALDGSGRLTVTGRRADTIITGGENVAPAQVEAVLAEHPAVADVAVHAHPDARWGEAVVASVVLAPGVTTSESDLRRHCAARLVPHQVPKRIGFVDALPRTASGKLLRRELR